MGRKRALVIGWRGGVGSTLLRLLAGHPAGRRLARSRELVLPSGKIGPADLAARLADLAIAEVIEVADVDTLAFSRACAERGANYLAASMQSDGALVMPAARALLPESRPDVGDTSQLIGAGMNPGIVNALALAGVDELARRTGVPPDLYAIYITEIDTTTCPDARDDVFAMTWSPHQALEELLEPRATYLANGELVHRDHRPHEAIYTVRCGPHEIAAMLVPHEEVVTLGVRFPGVECAFFYAIPDAACRALRRHPDRGASAWPTRKLYPPYECRLAGGDRVGVLLCTRCHGELWIGFDTTVEQGARFGSNATLLQAATGVLAGWRLLGDKRGIHVVEELDWRAYLRTVRDVLGEPEVHHVRDAPVRPLAMRQCST